MGSFTDFFIKPAENTENEQATKDGSSINTNIAANASAPVVSQPTVSNFTNSTSIANAPLAPESHTSSTINTTADTDDNIIKMLWETILAANTPAPDYCEIKQNAAALANLGLPLEKQYEGAFNVLKAQYPNFTKADIINSIDTYIKLIENESVEGKKQCEEKQKKEVGDKETRVQQLTETANDILKQIEDLQKQHNNILSSITNLQTEIKESTKEIQIQAQKFENSVNVVLNSLKTDKNTINTLNI